MADAGSPRPQLGLPAPYQAKLEEVNFPSTVGLESERQKQTKRFLYRTHPPTLPKWEEKPVRRRRRSRKQIRTYIQAWAREGNPPPGGLGDSIPSAPRRQQVSAHVCAPGPLGPGSLDLWGSPLSPGLPRHDSLPAPRIFSQPLSAVRGPT